MGADPGKLFEEAINEYPKIVRRGLDKVHDTNPPTPEEEKAFYNMLMLSDWMSARQFILSSVDPSYIVRSNVLTLIITQEEEPWRHSRWARI